MTFTEAGVWQPERGSETPFSNVLAWTFLNIHLIRLEHLRYGTDNPVWLFDLSPTNEDAWVSASPHQCRDDCYSAEFRLTDRGMSVHWNITGPRKQNKIDYEYW